MNNKDKRTFMECVEAIKTYGYVNNPSAFKKAKANLPQTLFKFRTFEDYNLEAIKENYIYISPVENLDDPFEFILDFSTSKYYNFTEKKLNSRARKLVEKEIKKLGYQINSYDSQDIINIKFGYSTECNIYIAKTLESYMDGTYDYIKENLKKDMLKIGVCALTDKMDNKPMWSLYADNYRGYCVEYDYEKTNKKLECLFPVIYTKKKNNNFEDKLFLSVCSDCIRVYFNEHFGRRASFNELFCTKDKDWEYQSEWRIVGELGKHKNILQIKAVYLGFAVTKENEDKMIELAKEKGFKLYKMKKPDRTKKIKFVGLL